MAKQADVTLTIKARNEAKRAIDQLQSGVQTLIDGFDDVGKEAKSLDAEIASLQKRLVELDKGASGAKGYRELVSQTAKARAEYRKLKDELTGLKAKQAETVASGKEIGKAEAKQLEKAELAAEKASKAYKEYVGLLNQARAAAGTGSGAAGRLFSGESDRVNAQIAAAQKSAGDKDFRDTADINARRVAYAQLFDELEANEKKAAAVRERADAEAARRAQEANARVAAGQQERIAREKEIAAVQDTQAKEELARQKTLAAEKQRAIKEEIAARAQSDARAAETARRSQEAIRQLTGQNRKASLEGDDRRRYELAYLELLQREEKQLNRNVAAQKRANDEARRRPTAVAAGRGGSDKNNDFKIQRTSLDIAQRLRGQVLSLTSSYVGLFGIINQVNLALEEQKKFVSAQAKLGSAFQTTDFNVIGKELEFVRAQADRLGLDFLNLTNSYSSFAAAAKLAGASNEEVRTVFVRLAESARALGLDTESTQRIFKATEQIFSKAKVTSEELRQQLGDSLPGAVAAFAKSMGKTGPELDKMLQNGEVSVSKFVNFITDYAAQLQDGLGTQISSLDAEFQRFGNTTRDLRAEFSKGLEPGLKDALRELSESFKDKEVRTAIRELGEGIGDLLRWMAEWRKEIALVVGAVAGFYAFKMAGQFVLGFGADIGKAGGFLKSLPGKISGAIDSLAALEAILFGTSVATKALTGALGLLAAGGAGYAFGTWLRDTFASVRKLGVGMTEVAVISGLLARRLSGNLTAEQFSDELEKAYAILDDMYADAGKSAEDIAAEQAKIADQAERSKAAAEAEARARDEILALLQQANREYDDSLKKAREKVAEGSLDEEATKVKKVADEYNGLAQAIQEAFNAKADANRDNKDFNRDAEAGVAASEIAALEAQRNEKIAAIRQGFRDKENQKIDAANNERLRKEKQLQDLLKNLEQSALQTTADTLDERIALIQRKYAESAAELAKSGAADSDKQRIQALLGEAQAFEIAAERKKDATDKVTEAEKKLNDVIAARDAYIETTAAKVTAGAISQAEATELVRQKYAETKDEVILLANELLKLPGLTEAQRQALETVKIEATGAAEEQKKLAVTGAEVADSIASGMTDAIDDFVSGTKSAGEALQGFFADLLKDIARAIIQQTILNALMSMGGMPGVPAGVFHSGGVIGNSSGGRARRVSPSVFVGAPRYHSGGMAGLAPNEVPAILERGEEVLTKSDPRHAANGGAAPTAAGQTPQNIQVINTIDTGAMQQAVLTGPNAAKQIVNIVRANRGAFKQALA